MDNLDGLTDEQLVLEIRSKNQELFRILVVRYQEKLIRYAIGIVGSYDEAQDIVQTTFIKSFRNLKGFNIKKKFSSWIYRIAHNEAINHIKKNKKLVSLEKSELERVADDKKSDEEIIDEKIFKEKIRAELDKLPLHYREVLILYYFEQYSYAEISEILHMPTSTIGTKIRRAKKLFAKKINHTEKSK